MKYTYDFARLPNDKELLVEINLAAGRLAEKLKDIKVELLEISDYNKKYFGGKLEGLTGNLQKYSYVLAWSLAKSEVPLSEFVFIDYGGGSGMLSLLAKELGVGTVIFNDIFKASCKDSEIIGKAIGTKADYYVCGDIEEVLSFLKTKNIYCDAISSYDVIEHIYDIESFMKRISSLSKNHYTVVMSSGANSLNPIVRKTEMRTQVKIENENREKPVGYKERDCFEAYLSVRKRIIRDYIRKLGKNLSKNDILKLSLNTRGMIESDIENYVEKFIKSGILPEEPTHPTNTCDPYTGNWAEHLMDPYHLADILSENGFKVRVLAGYYGRSKSVLKRIIGSILNVLIFFSGRLGLVFSPFYTVYGRR